MPEMSKPAKDAFATIGLIMELIDKVPERTRDRNSAFFDGVAEKAEGIGRTIEKADAVTAGQFQALNNILVAVRKWVHD